MSNQKKTIKPLTEVELELMNAIWELGICTVKDVHVALSKERDLAYTSVATIMKILEQKGFLESQKGDRAHTYQPLCKRTEYEASSLRHLAKNLFHDDPSSMVMRLLSDTALSKDELQAIRKILDERIEK
jgi:predicted transcriptional regulator